MGIRNQMPPGFDEAVADFEDWCRLLLLNAMQRFGFFKCSGEVSHWAYKQQS